MEVPRGRSGAPVRCRSLSAGDVDGDGVADLVASCDGIEGSFLAWRGNPAIFPSRAEASAPTPLLAPVLVAPTAAVRPAPVMGGVTPETTAAALARLISEGFLDEPPAAVVGMRLNEDAIPDLVVLERGAAAPTLFLSAAFASFTVDTTADTPDATPGDGLCRDASGKCSLRAAITEANLTLAADTIAFNLGSGIPVINVTGSALPIIAQPLTINGATGGAMRIDVKSNRTFAGDGMRLANGATGCAILGLIVEGFQGSGIQINTGSNVVENCWVGLDQDGGGTGLGNQAGGIVFGTSAAANTVGGATAAQSNVVAHNLAFQIHLQSTGNVVQGNYVGTDITGLQDITAGQADGVVCDGCSGSTMVGGATATPGSPPGNLISGDSYGVRIRGGSGVTILGNLIGAGADGATLVGNSVGVGLEGGTKNNLVGGTTASARNVISAAGNAGVLVSAGPSGTATVSNVVQGNWIGTDLSGSQCLGNDGDGVYIEDNAQNNTVGGSAAAPGLPPGNLIACNGFNGIRITGTTSTGNAVQGNLIGADSAHPSLAGNAFHGIDLVDDPGSLPPTNGPSSTTVGAAPSAPGLCDGACNRISENVLAGIRVENDASQKNTFVGNAISTNGGLGIDLGAEGVTANDANDADTGPNALLNFPTIGSIQFDGSQTSVQGSYAGAANTTLTLDFYANPSGHDPSGFGEGEAWIGSQPITTNGSGAANFTFTVAGNRPYVSATARDAAGNTSELSSVFLNPGEAAANGLLASKGSGSAVAVNYSPACGAADHTIYSGVAGPSAMSGIAWSSAFCALGASGSAAFDPGTPAPGRFLYFVIVGRSSTVEGSYGRSTAGERPEAIGVGSCDIPQALSSSCP
jgi:CSLREA domain-containing protein